MIEKTKPQKVIIAGSTGSIGQSSIKILRRFPEQFSLIAFSYHNNIEEAKKVSSIFPKAIPFCSKKKSIESDLTQMLELEYDIFINSIVGGAGIHLTYKAAGQGKTILLANKESLVMAGDLVMEKVYQNKTTMLPIDSEHSSLFRLLQNIKLPQKLILTASGGALYNLTKEKIKTITIEEVLKHPTWKMGAKITVDSAGLINKALEIIEAHYLFSFEYDQIEAIIHPQSYVHAMIVQKDGSIFMHTSPPDMITPISFGLFYPNEPPGFNNSSLPYFYPNFSFKEIDKDRFPGFQLGVSAGKAKGGYPTVFNAANEIGVDAFLNKRIPFHFIPQLIDSVMQEYTPINSLNCIDQIFEIDLWSRRKAEDLLCKLI